MKASAPDSGTSWTLRMTPDEYGEILPTSSMPHKRLNALSVSGKPHINKIAVTWEFWGLIHLNMAVEVCEYARLILEK